MPTLAPFYTNSVMTAANYIDFACRIIVAMICGALVGLEREKRHKNAGLRTHIIVAIASCVMMIVSKYGFMDIVTMTQYKIQADGSRIAQGVIQAIGFLGAGVIFVKRESVAGLTTAAGIWATVGVGCAIGAGMYSIGIFLTILMIITQWMLHKHHKKYKSLNSGVVTCDLTKHEITFEDFDNYLTSIDADTKVLSITTDVYGHTIVKADVVFGPEKSMSDLVKKLQASSLVDSVEVYPSL